MRSDFALGAEVSLVTHRLTVLTAVMSVQTCHETLVTVMRALRRETFRILATVFVVVLII